MNLSYLYFCRRLKATHWNEMSKPMRFVFHENEYFLIVQERPITSSFSMTISSAYRTHILVRFIFTQPAAMCRWAYLFIWEILHEKSDAMGTFEYYLPILWLIMPWKVGWPAVYLLCLFVNNKWMDPVGKEGILSLEFCVSWSCINMNTTLKPRTSGNLWAWRRIWVQSSSGPSRHLSLFFKKEKKNIVITSPFSRRHISKEWLSYRSVKVN